MQSESVFRELWQQGNALLEQGLSYEDYARELAYLLFLKIADEKAALSPSGLTLIPSKYSWGSLLDVHGSKLLNHYGLIIEFLGKQDGLPGMMFQTPTNITDADKLEKLIQVIDLRTWHDE